MSIAVYNFQLNQGDDFELILQIKDANGTLFDLTGYTYKGQIKDKYDSKTTVASFNFTIANQVLEKGKVYVRLTNEQTAAIPTPAAKGANRRPMAEYIYDITETNPDHSITRILEGIITVSPNVTK